MRVIIEGSHYNKLEFEIPSFIELTNFLMLVTEYGIDINEVHILNNTNKTRLVLNEVEDDIS